MGNRWFGFVLQLIGLSFLAVMLASSQARWFPPTETDRWPQPTVPNAGFASLLLWMVFLAIASGLANVFIRSVASAIVATAAIVAVVLTATIYAFTSHQPLGPAYALTLFASLAMLVGMSLVPARDGASAESANEVGEHVDGKRHGPWLVYRKSKVVEMRRYDAGELIETRPYER